MCILALLRAQVRQQHLLVECQCQAREVAPFFAQLAPPRGVHSHKGCQISIDTNGSKTRIKGKGQTRWEDRRSGQNEGQ